MRVLGKVVRYVHVIRPTERIRRIQQHTTHTLNGSSLEFICNALNIFSMLSKKWQDYLGIQRNISVE